MKHTETYVDGTGKTTILQHFLQFEQFIQVSGVVLQPWAEFGISVVSAKISLTKIEISTKVFQFYKF